MHKCLNVPAKLSPRWVVAAPVGPKLDMQHDINRVLLCFYMVSSGCP